MSNALAHRWHRYRALPTLQRELVTFAVMLLVGLTLVPLAIWVGGQTVLGDYALDPSGTPVGGLGALWMDYLRGVFTLSLGYWLALLGPWLLLLVLRGMTAIARTGQNPEPRPQAPTKRHKNQPLA